MWEKRYMKEHHELSIRELCNHDNVNWLRVSATESCTQVNHQHICRTARRKCIRHHDLAVFASFCALQALGSRMQNMLRMSQMAADLTGTLQPCNETSVHSTKLCLMSLICSTDGTATVLEMQVHTFKQTRHGWVESSLCTWHNSLSTVSSWKQKLSKEKIYPNTAKHKNSSHGI